MFTVFEKSLYVREIDLWIDSMRKRERGYVSHGHSDHARAHGTVVATPHTAEICRARFRKRRDAYAFEEHPYNRPWRCGEYELTLFSAGHVLGSSQLLIEGAQGRFVYTGDFKLESSFSCEAPEVKRCDVVLMECTFGRPRYVFPPRDEIAAQMTAFARETLAAGEVPVFHAYSLGKSQEAMAILADAQIPMVVHEAAAQIADIYQRAGARLGNWRCYDPAEPVVDAAVIWPPSGKSFPRTYGRRRVRCAMLSGWAIDGRSNYRYNGGRAFALSDHADYPSLLRYLELAQPRKVLLNHGWRDFATQLRKLGFDAEYLEENQQLALL